MIQTISDGIHWKKYSCRNNFHPEIASDVVQWITVNVSTILSNNKKEKN